MNDELLKPAVDCGLSRVFDCNSITIKLRERDQPPKRLFFRNGRLNNVVIMKQGVPQAERRQARMPAVGTKLFFPFNANSSYFGGNTIFVHDTALENALREQCGLDKQVDAKAFEDDVRLLHALDRLPTLEPFLLMDTLRSAEIEVNEEYLQIGAREAAKIEAFIRERAAPLVAAALPEAPPSDATALAAQLAEAKDAKALAPLIRALHLAEDKAMPMLHGWKVIAFYSCLYESLRPRLIEIAKWLKDTEVTVAELPPIIRRRVEAMHDAVKTELRALWQLIHRELTAFESVHEQVVAKTDLDPFLGFLWKCGDAVWRLGDGIGKLDHAILCWDQLTLRHHRRQLSLEGLEQVLRTMEEILDPAHFDVLRAAS